MNRDILFRGKRIIDYCNTLCIHCVSNPTKTNEISHNKEWVEGFLTINENHKNSHVIWEALEDGLFEQHFVNKNTVGQYTGLIDKKGKRIFEGDIIQLSFDNGKNHYQYEVVFKEGSFGTISRKTNRFSPLNAFYVELEIIGNIKDEGILEK